MAAPRLSQLQPYTRRVRPADPAQLSAYMDEEFRRIEAWSRDLVAALKQIDSRT